MALRISTLWRAVNCVSILLLAAVLFGGQPSSLAQTLAAPKVEVRGVRVVAEGYGPNKDEARAFNWSKGVTLGLLVTLPQGVIMELDWEKSQVAQLRDDTGADLLTRQDSPSAHGPVVRFPRISADGKAAMVEIESEKLPAPGATGIHATGFVLLTCAARRETFSAENVALKEGSRFSTGATEFEIAYAGVVEPNWRRNWPNLTLDSLQEPPPEAWEITVHSRGVCPDLVKMSLLATGGQDTGTQLILRGKPVDGSVSMTFILSRKADAATIAATYCRDVKEVKIPFDVKASLGLEP